eukprot:TRINITY_DN8303_c0_g1_i1.p2 TRINITY_DN8303_c0_g1~~TRINITY_DN8303_c0_g1_i1.p2  ORF type:complete len:171 (-),score=23.17 TRINITY_DN8303_c0_g1_i1:15-491(-)
MSGIAKARLQQERRNWRKDHPYGFFARPDRTADGEQDLMVWKCGIPGKEGTLWAGGTFPLTIRFSEDFPSKPPHCAFPKGFFHPNIYPSGTVCLSILNEDENWTPTISVKQILLGVQELLDDPNPKSPAQDLPYQLFVKNKTEYTTRIKAQTKTYTLD